MNTRARSTLLALLALASLLLAQTAPPTVVDVGAEPYHHPVFQNEYVRVLQPELPPHVTTGWHRHDHDYVFIGIGSGDLLAETMAADGTITKEKPSHNDDGEVAILRGEITHRVTNTSDSTFRCVAVELLKPGKYPKASFPGDQDYARAAWGWTRALSATDRVTIFETRLPPGATAAKYTHKRPQLMIAVTDLNLRSDVEGQSSARIHQKPGDYAWTSGGLTDTLANVGSREARFITLEFP